MIVLSGADLILPDRILSPGTLTIEGELITSVTGRRVPSPRGGVHVELHNHLIVPGFIDVHVHGVEGHDSLDEPAAVSAIAKRLPRYGVTAFCPTTVACSPPTLERFLEAVRRVRKSATAAAARVLPAHLESNFINPAFRGAQPEACLRLPPATAGRNLPAQASATVPAARDDRESSDGAYSGLDILAAIERYGAEVGIVTLAPELDGARDLIRLFTEAGHRVSMGHSGATFEQAREAIDAGARHATHLFNRMPRLDHREPGLAGAVLSSDEVAAELICDGHHVHPAMLRAAIAAKRPSRVMAITDGTSGAGLPAGARASLGGRSITVRDGVAKLDEGTVAGSVLTMDGAFRLLVGRLGLTPVDAATMCATTPAERMGLSGQGAISPGALADLVVLDRQLNVVQTYVGGHLAFSVSQVSAP